MFNRSQHVSWVMVYILYVLWWCGGSSGSLSACGLLSDPHIHEMAGEVVNAVVCPSGSWTSLKPRKKQLMRCIQNGTSCITWKCALTFCTNICSSICCRTVMSTVHSLGFLPTLPLAWRSASSAPAGLSQSDYTSTDSDVPTLTNLLLSCLQKEDKVVYCPGFFDLYRILYRVFWLSWVVCELFLL